MNNNLTNNASACPSYIPDFVRLAESLAGNGFPVKWRKISAKYLEIV
ncbi:hypothetical protein [Anaerovibrio slackiae]